jgi:neutral trehalase
MILGFFYDRRPKLNREAIPSIHFYDQDFVDLYDRSWVWIDEFWKKGTEENGFVGNYVSYNDQKTFDLFNCCLSSLFLNYSNQTYSPFDMIDFFYSKQEPNGAIRAQYSIVDGTPVLTEDNPEGIVIPLIAYVEFMFYHKIGNKKRLKDIVPVLENYFNWIKEMFQKENGLFSVPVSACLTGNVPREKTVYPVDFNTLMALNALYMSNIGDILNDKELSFRYKRLYFSLKTRINNLMWDQETGFYHDLDAQEQRLPLKMIGAYWTLLAEIPNDERAARMVEYLKDPEVFGTDNPFPSVSVDSPCFKENVQGYCGAVVPSNIYCVVKGLEKYGEYVFARECAIRHVYFILDTLHPGEDVQGDVWEAYLPNKEGTPASTGDEFPRKKFLPQVCLVTITMMIEDIIGLDVSLPRKTVYWMVPNLEVMGIEKLSLKRNLITILSNKNARGWEIRLESEKLYYFTIEIIEENKKKTLPIPSGKCSMLIDKL